MISIECHRVGVWWPGKPEFDNRIDSGQGKSFAIDVAIPFNAKYTLPTRSQT